MKIISKWYLLLWKCDEWLCILFTPLYLMIFGQFIRRKFCFEIHVQYMLIHWKWNHVFPLFAHFVNEDKWSTIVLHDKYMTSWLHVDFEPNPLKNKKELLEDIFFSIKYPLKILPGVRISSHDNTYHLIPLSCLWFPLR